MHPDSTTPQHPSGRPDRRRGARVVAGVRITTGRPEERVRDGWMQWTPEARTRALDGALRDYLADHGPTLAACERAHGVPRDLLAARLNTGRHPALAALPEPVRLTRAALEVKLHSALPRLTATRWSVAPETLAARVDELTNALRLTAAFDLLRRHRAGK